MNPALLSALMLLVFVSGCATRETTGTREVPIGRGVSLNLPMPPGYLRETTILQVVRGAYGADRRTFQSLVSLSPDEVRVIITLPGGPRIMTIDWSARGVATERSALAPTELRGENVLADMVISLWDLKAVAAALPDGATVTQTDGVRTVHCEGREVITVRYAEDAIKTRRMVLTNHDFGYELVISSQRTEDG